MEHPVPAALKGILVQVFSLRNKGLKRRKQRLRNGVRGGLLALGMAAVASLPTAALAQGNGNNQPVLLNADELTYDETLGIVIASGDVELAPVSYTHLTLPTILRV